VSKASDDLPEPDGPVNTMSRFFGRRTSTCFRLCSAAPAHLDHLAGDGGRGGGRGRLPAMAVLRFIEGR
jgi:hypothetical protein